VDFLPMPMSVARVQISFLYGSLLRDINTYALPLYRVLLALAADN